MNSTKIKPQHVNVLAEVTKLPTEKDGVYVGSEQTGQQTQAYYTGTALAIGKNANLEDQCPELKEGDGIVFDQVAGYHVPTEDTFCKVIRGHDIVATVKDIHNMNADTIFPTKDRILVEVIKESLVKDGVYDGSAEDPRDAATQKGRVIRCAKGADQYEEGEIVAFDPWVGNPILNDGTTFLKTINSFDILFSLSK